MLYKSLPSVKIVLLPLLLALILLIVFMFKKSPKYEIVATGTFSCIGMEEFTFEYPIFKGWEPNLTRALSAVNNVCVIFLNRPNDDSFSNIGPTIVVTKINKPGYPAPESPILEYPPKLTLKNPQGISYQGDLINSFSDKPITEANKFVQFYTNDFVLKIELQPVGSLGKGFSNDIFFKTVIESFKFNSNLISKEQALVPY